MKRCSDTVQYCEVCEKDFTSSSSSFNLEEIRRILSKKEGENLTGLLFLLYPRPKNYLRVKCEFWNLNFVILNFLILNFVILKTATAIVSTDKETQEVLDKALQKTTGTNLFLIVELPAALPSYEYLELREHV